MQLIKAFFFILFALVSSGSSAQIIPKKHLGSGSDLCIYDSAAFSLCHIESSFIEESKIVFCPAGIERSSQSDLKKRQSFDWVVKYDNIYFANKRGFIYEGMNRHGFSASLMFMDENQLPEQDKEHIPIESSLAINFFIDHFKCVDTALLAVWDIRLYSLIHDRRWPFRIVLHDTTGATAILEFIEGSPRIFTPSAPAFVVAGSDYTRLVELEHIPEALPQNKIEALFLNIVFSGFPPNLPLILLQQYMQEFKDESFYAIFRYHAKPEYYILTPENDEVVFDFNEIEFPPGTELSTRFF